MSAVTSRFTPLVEQYFDRLADGEFERLAAEPIQEVSLHIHETWLRRCIERGQRVLEVGAGAGRFTQKLHALGARVVVADLSGVQLGINRRNAGPLGYGPSVESWERADICAMPQFADASFDAVVAYGGPLSYALERREAAAAECRRVLKPGGTLLASVMSMWGTFNRWYATFLKAPPSQMREIIRTGDVTPVTAPGTVHPHHLFRAAELKDLLSRHAFRDVRLSSSHGIAHLYDPLLAQARPRPDVWANVLAFELAAAESEGYVETGTHLIAAATA
jgi:ubiquinone/menaquinone biosynthesis C-methylase UbiE